MSAGKQYHLHFVHGLELDGPDFFAARSEAVRLIARDASPEDDLVQRSTYAEWRGEWDRGDVYRGREGVFVSFDGAKDIHVYFFPLRAEAVQEL